MIYWTIKSQSARRKSMALERYLKKISCYLVGGTKERDAPASHPQRGHRNRDHPLIPARPMSGKKESESSD